MQVGMDFGWLLDRFLVDFGLKLGVKLGAKLAPKSEKKRCQDDVNKNIRKKEARAARAGRFWDEFRRATQPTLARRCLGRGQAGGGAPSGTELEAL